MKQMKLALRDFVSLAVFVLFIAAIIVLNHFFAALI